MKYFSSDYHFSHKAIIQYANRPFITVAEMNETIIANLLANLKKGDDLYFLGDLSWDIPFIHTFLDRISHLNFYWISGNHDPNTAEFSPRCCFISAMKEIKIAGNHATLCHYPMLSWNKSHRNAFMLYGHHHQNSHGTADLKDKTVGKMLNVNLEFHDYRPWSEEEVVEYMKTRADNWDFIK